jgi:hypothetical protein
MENGDGGIEAKFAVFLVTIFSEVEVEVKITTRLFQYVSNVVKEMATMGCRVSRASDNKKDIGRERENEGGPNEEQNVEVCCCLVVFSRGWDEKLYRFVRRKTTNLGLNIEFSHKNQLK